MANKNVQVFDAYSDEYKWKIRQVWFEQSRPTPVKLLDMIPPDEHGRKPNPVVITRWRKDELWDIWADELDSRVMEKVETSLIAEKAEMLKRQAAEGWNLQTMGLEYLKAEGFDSSSSAVTAIIKGAELERASRGIGEMLVRMAEMGDDALKQEIMKYINRASENNQIVDADVIPEKEEKEDE